MSSSGMWRCVGLVNTDISSILTRQTARHIPEDGILQLKHYAFSSYVCITYFYLHKDIKKRRIITGEKKVH
jgi:hypothetical protein